MVLYTTIHISSFSSICHSYLLSPSSSLFLILHPLYFHIITHAFIVLICAFLYSLCSWKVVYFNFDIAVVITSTDTPRLMNIQRYERESLLVHILFVTRLQVQIHHASPTSCHFWPLSRSVVKEKCFMLFTFNFWPADKFGCSPRFFLHVQLCDH